MGPSVLVIGAGAVGLYYGARLQKGGHTVQFLGRSSAAALKNGGLQVRSLNEADVSPNDSFRLTEINITTDWSEADPAELVLFTVKTSENERLREAAARLVKPGGTLVVMQNGMGEEERFAELLGAERVLAGVCFIGATLAAPHELTYSGPASITVADFTEAPKSGEASDSARSLAAIFAAAGVRASAAPDHALVRWKKLVWNIPFNGLCVVLQTNSAALMQNTEGRDLVVNIMQEVIAGARSHGRQIAESFIDDMIEATAKLLDYKPSMVHDFRKGRALEIESMYRRPIEIAARSGCSMPRTEALFQQLSFLAAQRK